MRKVNKLYLIIMGFGLIFSAIAFNQLGLLRTGEIPYPGQKEIQVSSVADDEVFYNTLDEMAKTDKSSIYHSVTTDDGPVAFVFGRLPHKSAYPVTQDRKVLQHASSLGSYYVDGRLSAEDLSKLKAAGVTITVNPTGIVYLTMTLLLPVGLSSFTFYILCLLYVMTIYAFKVSAIRLAMIRRSLGQSNNQVLWELLVLTSTLFVVTSLLYLTSGYRSAVYGQATLNLMLMVFGILVLLTLLSECLFQRLIRREAITSILKRQSKTGKLHYGWLLAIATAVLLTSFSGMLALETYKKAASRQKILKNWQGISQFASLAIKTSPISSGTTEEAMAQEKQARQVDEAKWRSFYESLGDDGSLWLADPMHVEQGQTLQVPDFDNPDQILTLDSGLVAKVWITNPYNVRFSEQLQQLTSSVATDEAPVVIYVPESYRDQMASIKPIVTCHLVGMGMTDQDIAIKVIPDGFKLFKPDFNDIRDMFDTRSFVTNQIIAQFDIKQFPQVPSAISAVVDDIQYGLFNQKGLAQAIENSEVKDQIVDIQTPYLIIKNIQHEALSQLRSNLFALVSLVCAQVFVIYTFISLQLSKDAKRIAIYQIYAKPVYRDYARIYLMVGLAVFTGMIGVFVLTQGTRANLNLVVVMLFYLLIIGIMLVISALKQRQGRLAILNDQGA